jgi:hypothetical protein
VPAIVLPGFQTLLRAVAGAAAFALSFLLTLTTPAANPTPPASRILPAFFEDTTPVHVLIELHPPRGVAIQTVQDSFPQGWIVSDINYGGTLDPSGHTLRWGPFPDDFPRTLSYRVTPPLDGPQTADFLGTAVFQAAATAIQGPTQIPKRPGQVLRTLPAHYLPGQPVTVRLEARPGASTLAWALQESIPAGWSPSPVPPGASFDPATRSLKWGPFFDNTPRAFDFTLLPNPTLRSPASFNGSAIFEAVSVPVEGPAVLPIQPSHLTRSLPQPFNPGSTATIQLTSTPANHTTTHSIEEDLPPGLTPSSISHDGAWDPALRKVKWGPFPDATARTLSFEIPIPNPAPDTYSFTGRGAFDAITRPTDGDSTWTNANPSPVSSLTLNAPPTFTPGQPFTVTLDAQPAPGSRVHALELTLPADWTLVSSSHAGSLDIPNRRIKWGPFEDDSPRSLTAQMRPDATTRAPVELTAVGWFDANRITASAPAPIAPEPSRISRTLPPRFTPGTPFTVHLDLQPASTAALVFVEESPPPSASVSGITDGGSYDIAQAKVKWGPFTGNTRRTLSYQITLSSAASREMPFAGLGVVDLTPVPITGDTSSVPNLPPIAQPDLLHRPPLPAAKFSLVEFLANDSDPNGDPLRLVAVGNRSASGANVRLSGPWVFYDTPSLPAEDQISYTIEDAFGGRSVTSATILFSESPTTSRLAIIAVIPDAGGTARIRFIAVPGVVCRIEVSPDLRSWTFLAEGTAGPLGIGEVIDPDPASTPVRFYRVSVR